MVTPTLECGSGTDLGSEIQKLGIVLKCFSLRFEQVLEPLLKAFEVVPHQALWEEFADQGIWKMHRCYSSPHPRYPRSGQYLVDQSSGPLDVYPGVGIDAWLCMSPQILYIQCMSLHDLRSCTFACIGNIYHMPFVSTFWLILNVDAIGSEYCGQ